MSFESSRDRKDLKIQALLEKISTLTANYENQVAELRIDLTLLDEEKQSYQMAAQALEVKLAEKEAESVEVSEEADADSSD